MRIEIACFTARGETLGNALLRGLEARGDAVALTRCGRDGESVGEWARRNFTDADALLFVGAVGIAVRAVAPFVVSKTSDPAVVVVDETGKFVVPVLSGHIGGANRLAEFVAGMVGATAVVTTATDLNRVFAADSWAAEKGYAILNPRAIKTVSSRLLNGEPVRMRCAFPVRGGVPEGVILADGDDVDVTVDVRPPPAGALGIVPPALTLGVGCRRGATEEDIAACFGVLRDNGGWASEAFGGVYSIDVKRDEPGLIAFAGKMGLPFVTFDAASLAEVVGDFAGSEFVTKTVGVDNVCERSAVLGSGGGKLVTGKTVWNGVAMAAALGEVTIDFGRG